MPNNESPETQFALLRKDISNLTDMVRELVERMALNEKENRQKLDEHERRLTIVEERQTSIREFKETLYKIGLWLVGLLLSGFAIAALIILNQ